MSAIAIVLAEMGHQVSGSDIRERPVLERVRAAGVDVHVGHDRRHVAGCSAVTSSTAVPATQRRARRSSQKWDRRAQSRRHVVVDLRAGEVARRCRHSWQDHDDIDADADPRRCRSSSVVHHRRRRHRHGHRRPVDGRRVAGRRGRRERRHASRAAAVRHDPAERRGGSSRLLRHGGRDRHQLRPVPRADGGPEGAVHRRSRLRRAGVAARARSPTERRQAADYRAVDISSDHGSNSFTVVHRGTHARHRRPAVARDPQRAQRARRVGHGRSRSGSTSTSPPRRSPSSAASLVASTSVASTPAQRWSTTTRTCRARSARCSRRRAPVATVGDDSLPCSSPIASTAWPSCRRRTATRSSMPTSSC